MYNNFLIHSFGAPSNKINNRDIYSTSIYKTMCKVLWDV